MGDTITMDGIVYHIYVDYGTLKRTFEVKEGSNSGESISGKSIRDILGTGYTYSMTFRPNPKHISDYDNFYMNISQPCDYHEVTFPFGQTTLSFKAKVKSASDTYDGNLAGTECWKGLSVTFEYFELARI